MKVLTGEDFDQNNKDETVGLSFGPMRRNGDDGQTQQSADGTLHVTPEPSYLVRRVDVRMSVRTNTLIEPIALSQSDGLSLSHLLWHLMQSRNKVVSECVYEYGTPKQYACPDVTISPFDSAESGNHLNNRQCSANKISTRGGESGPTGTSTFFRARKDTASPHSYV